MLSAAAAAPVPRKYCLHSHLPLPRAFQKRAIRALFMDDALLGATNKSMGVLREHMAGEVKQHIAALVTLRASIFQNSATRARAEGEEKW